MLFLYFYIFFSPLFAQISPKSFLHFARISGFQFFWGAQCTPPPAPASYAYVCVNETIFLLKDK